MLKSKKKPIKGIRKSKREFRKAYALVVSTLFYVEKEHEKDEKLRRVKLQATARRRAGMARRLELLNHKLKVKVDANSKEAVA